MPRRAKTLTSITNKKPTIKTRKQLSDANSYGYEWAKKRNRYIRQHPVCYCDAVRVWIGSAKHEAIVSFGYEGEQRPAAIVDHVQPLTAGGECDIENYQSLCHRCHNTKTKRYG